MEKKALRFKNMTVPRQQGELARFRVIGGPDAGAVFVAIGSRVTIGRDEESAIVLTDLKASRRHVEVTLTPDGAATLHDAGSSNGVLVNGTPQFKAQLRTGDKIGLGMTVIEFIGSEKGATQAMTRMPPRTSASIGGGVSGLTQFIQKTAQEMAESPALEAFNKGDGGPQPPQRRSIIERNRKLVLAMGALTALALLMPEVEKKQRQKKIEYSDPLAVEASRSISSLAPPVVDKEAKKQADIHFKDGFREYREGNYLRAQVEFETALQIYADHPLAKQYLDTTKKTMAEEAKARLKLGRREEEANRFPASFSYYDSVRRMFFRDQSNPLYKEAEKHIEELKKKETEWDR